MRLTRLLAPLALTLAVATRPAAAQQPAGDASHRAAVQRLMEVTRVREMTEGNIDSVLAGQLRQMPQLAAHAGLLREFYREQMAWKVLEPEYTRVYLEVFTEPEVRELIAFYQTPLGQKMLTKMPLLMAKSNELAARRVQAAMPQLMQRLMEAMQGGGATRPDSTRPPRS